jgi:molybdopterin molybdotransferase
MALRSVEEARATILEHTDRLPAETLPLAESGGRVLAQELRSTRDLPPADNSAMDGYAVHAADLDGANESAPVSLPCLGSQLAGGTWSERVLKGTVVRIMTGGVVPEGVDAVVMRENTDESEVGDDDRGTVRFLTETKPGANIRRRGEDVAKDDVVGAPGDVITPARLNLLASAGHVEVAVTRRPRVAVLASGDELRELGEPLGPHDIVNSNAHALAAGARALGAEAELIGIAGDSLEDHRAKIESAGDADVLITIGGVSAGTHDFVRPALEALGVELDVWKVAMRPGKPVAFGRRGAQRVFGLPGNPVSSQVGFELFVKPALRRMMGMTKVAPRTVRATLVGDGTRKKAGWTFFLRARAGLDDEGRYTIELEGKQGSGMISGLARANALCVVPAEASGVESGGQVDAILLDDSMLLA